ncbi:sigma-70 family RNA polymerase sigma factor [Fulvivirga aurantia]|uniref:sigma-70 family RNA polymerase sigma factor n=1 Tax=Fulvivirga aurantia TaxID=2529383 RepID=UPI001FEC92B4|nr:sigma-70 family RNA polymerase sigma factor [Fulvivirga aurantia]
MIGFINFDKKNHTCCDFFSFKATNKKITGGLMSKTERFTELIKANEGIIFKITSVYSTTDIDQKDLYQEIVTQLWTAFDRFRNESKISTWIYRVALNTAITNIRKVKKQGFKVPIDQAVLNYAEVTDPLLEERIRMLYKNIESLDELDKGIVLLYLEKRSHDEIAQIIGLSVSNIGTRLSRIRNKLKTQMTNKVSHGT